MPADDYKRKLAAIFSADVVGYSRMMAENEAETVSALTENREMMSVLIIQHRGRVVDSPGDNLLAEFPSVVDAVMCAVAVQKELKARNADLPEGRKMLFRIGINLGDVIEQDDRIYGDGVNIAARLESLAEPGGVCLSRTAFDQVEDKLPLGYEYMGAKNVKNISRPLRAYRVLLEPPSSGRHGPEEQVDVDENISTGRKSQPEHEDTIPRDGRDESDINAAIRKHYEIKTGSKTLFYRHLMLFLGGSVFLFILNMMVSPGVLWFYWPVTGWTLLLFFHWSKTSALSGARLEKILDKASNTADNLKQEGRLDAYEDMLRHRVANEVRFFRQVLLFLGVSVFLFIINLLTSPGTLWFYWPVLGMGAGLFVFWVRFIVFPDATGKK